MFKLKTFTVISFLTFGCAILTSTAKAVVDPLSSPNNKFGIHIIQATPDEASPAAKLVNSSEGDWGYITILIEGKDKKKDKWQEFFNDLRRRHLIPLVRLATIPEQAFWKRPDEGEAQVWADFLDSLNWPTKNRYVIIYNEPNHAKEWGNYVDAKAYAKVLDQTITALKSKNQDFFVLNAGLDASAPQQLPNYQDQVSFMTQMNETIPGIFDKLDGWVSHSYPNPGFVGSPYNFGRGTVRTYLWELSLLRSLGVTKNLPVFIAETGWKHAEGIVYDARLPNADTLSDYYTNAFIFAWKHPQLVAVTPFLLSYQEPPFDHFSFKKVTGEKQEEKLLPTSQVLGVEYPEYYPFYQQIMNLPKVAGKPMQEIKAKLTKGEIYSSIVAGETYQISLTFKNIGQSIWDKDTQLAPIEGGRQLGIEAIGIAEDKMVEPNQDYIFNINLKAPQQGKFKVVLNLFTEGKQFDSKPVEFTTEVKLPVILQVLTSLKWKDSAAGQYFLKISGVVGDSSQKVILDTSSKSQEIEARYLLPDYAFDFTLERSYYHPKTIRQEVKPGVNVLDFGILQPNLLQAILNLKEFWKLLPWSK